MTTNQLTAKLADAVEDLNCVLRLMKKGQTSEAKELLAQCFEIRMAVWGGAKEVINLMEKFDVYHNEIFLQLHS